jgi:magnesium transporter
LTPPGGGHEVRLTAMRRVGGVSGVETAPAGAGPGDGRADWAADSVAVECLRCEGGSWRTERVPLDAVRAAVATGGVLWVGLHDPDAPTMETVAAQLGLPALAVEDAVHAHQRPKLEQYGDQTFVVLKPVAYHGPERELRSGEIAVFLGTRFVVTVQHGDTAVLEQTRHRLAADRPGVERPAEVLHRLADVIVDGYESTLETLNAEIDDVEEKVFGRGDGDHAERIYELKQHMAELRRAVAPLKTPMHRLATADVPGVDEELTPYFRDVHDHVLRAADGVEAADRLLSDVLQADISRVSVRQSELALRQNDVTARQNEDMRKISAWAAIGLVPTAIAGVYGMNFDNMPELRWRYGYFIVLGVIASACLVLYTLFRRNKWL